MFEKEMENSIQGLFMGITHQYFLKNFHVFSQWGLHPGQLPMLWLLGTKDGLSQREIAERLKIKPPTVTMTIRRLEKMELLYRKQDEKDQRVSRIYMTDKGRECFGKIREIMRRNEELMFLGFDETEICLIRRFFKQILENVKRISMEDYIDCERKENQDA